MQAQHHPQQNKARQAGLTKLVRKVKQKALAQKVKSVNKVKQKALTVGSSIFFGLRAAKVRSSCEEGPGQSALQSAYHDPQLDVTELNQIRTTKSFRPKLANKQINKLYRHRKWQKSVGSKSVQGEDRKERVANRELCR